MNEYYIEQLVKRKTGAADLLVKIVMIALTVLSFALIFVFALGIFIPVILIVADYFIFRSMDVEYEYLYMNGDLDIDKILGKSKRKKVYQLSMDKVELVAPTGANELYAFRDLKTKKFSSNSGQKTYEMIVSRGGQRERIVFEPNEKILQGMKMQAPRKVII